MFKTILINILIEKCRRQFFVDSLRNAVLHYIYNYNVHPQKISLPPHTSSEKFGSIWRIRYTIARLLLFNIYVVPRGASCASYLNTELYQKAN